MTTLVVEEVFLKTRVDASAKVALDAIQAEMGMTQKEIMSRLLTWFADVQPEVRYAILGPGSIRAAVARLVLERMAASERAEAEAGERLAESVLDDVLGSERTPRRRRGAAS